MNQKIPGASDSLPIETNDDRVLRMLAGANFGPGASLILPSGERLSGVEAQAFTAAFKDGMDPIGIDRPRWNIESDSESPEIDFGDVFKGPIGVNEGTARDISGRINVTQLDGLYTVEATRFDKTQTAILNEVIITSGTATVDIDDQSPESGLNIHRLSGDTNITSGDRTVIFVSKHSGYNNLNGFVVVGKYKEYDIYVPEGRETKKFSWVNRTIRVDQISGYVNISLRGSENYELDARKDSAAITESRRSNPLDSRFDDWTGDSTIDRARLVQRALESARLEAKSGKVEEKQNTDTRLRPQGLEKADKKKWWKRNR
ncbi:hypothetical protein H7X68_01795 [Candidatus Saccharibacteria bacterium]|nr:hypothetical protein [Candidatus Saccharibacteria bacterium]